MFGLGKGRTVSYVDSHNSAVIKYRRYCRSFIWVGIINFLGLIVGIIQHYFYGFENIPFYYCFGINDFLFNLLNISGIHVVFFWIIAGLILIATTAGAVLLGVYSSYGKKKILFTLLGVYLIDWIFTFLTYFLITADLIGLMIDAGIHVVASFFLVLALYHYYKVINIEKHFKNVPTVAETKEKEKELKNGN